MSSSSIRSQLLNLLADYKDFNSGPIDTSTIPSAVEFAKQVSKGCPAIYRAYDKVIDRSGKLQTWIDPSLIESAAFTWTRDELERLVDEEVEVAVTPNGRADDLHNVDGKNEPIFLAPATVHMTIAVLLETLDAEVDNSNEKPVYYLQSQNSNLTTTTLKPILRHVPGNFPFAEPVLGAPEAINIWIGDERSVTSTHRDPYENLYLVLKGSKTFTLYPPVDEVCLPVKHVLTGQYVYDENTQKFDTVIDESESSSRIPWVSIDPCRPKEELLGQHSAYEHATPRVVTVSEGEILYLPGGWYHHVQQQCGVWDEDGKRAPCIAVNYWYDMEYEGEKYVMRQFVSRLVEDMREEEARS